MLSRKELKALHGLPHLPLLLYHVAIRPRMNPVTGLVKHITWKLLADDIAVKSAPGIKQFTANRRMMERASQHLEKRLIVERISAKNDLIYKCQLADFGNKAVREAVNLDHKAVSLSATAENDHRPCSATVSKDSKNLSGEGLHEKKLALDLVLVKALKDKRVLCLFAPNRARDFFSNWLDENEKTGFSVTELNKHISDYFSYCQKKQAVPSETGIENLLKNRLFYREEKRENESIRREMMKAKQLRDRAITIREEDIADRIHSENIYRRNN